LLADLQKILLSVTWEDFSGFSDVIGFDDGELAILTINRPLKLHYLVK